MFNISNDEREVEICYRSYIVTKATTSYIVNSVIGCIVNLLLCFAGTFLNALVVYVFWKTPKLRYKVSYFMIMVLSSIDILVTLIVHPAHLVMSIAEIVGKPSCVYKTFYHIAALLLSGMSFLTFFVMNIERYLSIVHPIFHIKYVTKLRCLIVCSVFWSSTIICGPIAYPLRLNVQFVVTIAALVVVLGTCYIYVAIFYFARKRRQAHNAKTREDANIFVVEHSTQNSTLSEITSDRNPVDKTREKSSKTVSFLHDLQLAKIYLLVVFCSFILNLPNAIVLAMFHDEVKAVNGLVQSKIWTVTLVLMNSTVNSLIFFWANVKLRKEGLKVCKRLFRR